MLSASSSSARIGGAEHGVMEDADAIAGWYRIIQLYLAVLAFKCCTVFYEKI